MEFHPHARQPDLADARTVHLGGSWCTSPSSGKRPIWWSGLGRVITPHPVGTLRAYISVRR